MENFMTREKFNNTLKMIKSEDKNDQILALSILNEQTFQNNIAFILLCKKESRASKTLWDEHAPKIMASMEKLQSISGNVTLTFKNILRVLGEVDAPPEQVIFYTETLQNYLLKQYQITGFDFIKDLTINLEIEEYGLKQEPVPNH